MKSEQQTVSPTKPAHSISSNIFGAQHGIPTPPHPHKLLSLFFTEFMEKTWIQFFSSNYTDLNINSGGIKGCQLQMSFSVFYEYTLYLHNSLYSNNNNNLFKKHDRYIVVHRAVDRFRDRLAVTKEVLSMTFNAVPSFNGHDTS